MRGIILKDLYEGFCIRKNTLNWAISMIFISFLTGINSMMRGTVWVFADRSAAVPYHGKYIAADDSRAG